MPTYNSTASRSGSASRVQRKYGHVPVHNMTGTIGEIGGIEGVQRRKRAEATSLEMAE
ncbi:hypothetical protein EWM64_g10926 [Hericium alpestre]|uniref:Uncharacterized protein n=1 Tax=Hericium alpestre TaxID=135208 RepID=A0A4Y9ZE43_9AGAM|nr:hypothetical protein EWM64_g10926 [Hericium alpestre]